MCDAHAHVCVGKLEKLSGANAVMVSRDEMNAITKRYEYYVVSAQGADVSNSMQRLAQLM